MVTYLLIKSKGKEFVIVLYSSIVYLFLIGVIFGVIKAFISYLCIYMLFIIYGVVKIKRNYRFDIYFSAPGGGKSTTAVSETMDYLAKKRPVFANFNVEGAKYIDKQEISIKNPYLHDCLLVLDEAGLEYDNRGFKSNFTPDSLALFKKHRHRHIDIIMFSQDFEDMDKKLRKLATRLFLIKRSFIPFFIKCSRISKKIAIDKDTHQIIEHYSFVPFGSNYIFMPKTWKKFDSFD